MVERQRLETRRTRSDRREWVMKRRERTRRLIELGGLVAKAGLIDLTGDDRAVIFGALVEASARLGGDEREQLLAIWRRRGRRAFAESENLQSSAILGRSVRPAPSDGVADKTRRP
jgi:hypothetical protein